MLCTSCFVDDVTFSYNAANRTQNQIQCVCFISSPDGGTSPTTDNIVVSSKSPGGGTGGDVCRLRLHLVPLSAGLSRREIPRADTEQRNQDNLRSIRLR